MIVAGEAVDGLVGAGEIADNAVVADGPINDLPGDVRGRSGSTRARRSSVTKVIPGAAPGTRSVSLNPSSAAMAAQTCSPGRGASSP